MEGFFHTETVNRILQAKKVEGNNLQSNQWLNFFRSTEHHFCFRIGLCVKTKPYFERFLHICYQEHCWSEKPRIIIFSGSHQLTTLAE